MKLVRTVALAMSLIFIATPSFALTAPRNAYDQVDRRGSPSAGLILFWTWILVLGL